MTPIPQPVRCEREIFSNCCCKSRRVEEKLTPRDGLIITILVRAQHHLSDDTITEENEDENAKEFREWIPQKLPYPTPRQLGTGRDGILLGPVMIDESAVLSVRRACGGSASVQENGHAQMLCGTDDCRG